MSRRFISAVVTSLACMAGSSCVDDFQCRSDEECPFSGVCKEKGPYKFCYPNPDLPYVVLVDPPTSALVGTPVEVVFGSYSYDCTLRVNDEDVDVEFNEKRSSYSTTFDAPGTQNLVVRCHEHDSEPLSVDVWNVTDFSVSDESITSGEATVVHFNVLGGDATKVKCDVAVDYAGEDDDLSVNNVVNGSEIEPIATGELSLTCHHDDDTARVLQFEPLHIEVAMGPPQVALSVVDDGGPVLVLDVTTSGTACTLFDGELEVPVASDESENGATLAFRVRDSDLAAGARELTVKCSSESQTGASSAVLRVHVGQVNAQLSDLDDQVVQFGNIAVSDPASFEFDNLSHVIGLITVTCSGAATPAVTLPALREVTGTLSVLSCTAANFTITLGTAGTPLTLGGLVVTGNTTLTALALPALTEVNGAVDISTNTALESIVFGGPSEVGGDLNVASNGALTSIDLGAVTEVGGALSISTNAALESIDLGALTEVGGDLNVSGNGALESIGLGALNEVDGSLEVSENAALESIGLGALTEVGGNFKLNENQVLTGVSVAQFNSVGGTFAITFNDELTCDVIAEVYCGLETRPTNPGIVNNHSSSCEDVGCIP